MFRLLSSEKTTVGKRIKTETFLSGESITNVKKNCFQTRGGKREGTLSSLRETEPN